ncbi:MAG: hypothetical protein ACR2NR_19580 [Solirubrobacteraceae bacterium]
MHVPGVIGTDTGPTGLFVTTDGGRRVEGVMCTATSGESYEISLRLICGLVSLLVLGEQVKAAVRRTARTAQIEVDSVSVHVAALAVEAV